MSFFIIENMSQSLNTYIILVVKMFAIVCEPLLKGITLCILLNKNVFPCYNRTFFFAYLYPC